MAAFWLDDDGTQKIVHMGSGSGSTMVCVLADDAIDFLRLLAIGYGEICWGGFDSPPDSGKVGEPNKAFADWVSATFNVTIPTLGAEIVKREAVMEDSDSDDPFWRWTSKMSG